MTKYTIGTLFSGGGGADIGANMAGFAPVFAVEYDPGVAEVYRQNLGDHIRVGDILGMDPRDFPCPSLLHASPPCPNFSAAASPGDEPAPTVGSVGRVGNVPRAFIVGNGRWSAEKPETSPVDTITSNSNQKTIRAFLVGDQERQVNEESEPSSTIRAYSGGGALPRAFLVESRNTNQKYGDGLREETEPATTITTFSRPAHQPRAFVVDGNINEGERINVRGLDEPFLTVKATDNKRPARAWLSQGRVVKMSARALARFQSFPDSYILPKRDKPRKFKKGSVEEGWYTAIIAKELGADWRCWLHEYMECNDALACRVTGNAVPPLMASVVFGTFLP